MATSTPVPNEAPAEAGKSSILLPILCSLIGAGAVCGGMIFFLLHSGKLLGGTPAPAVAVKTELPTVALTLDPFLVNLADAGSHSYLRTSLVLKIDAPQVDKKAAEKKADAKGAVDPDAAARNAAMRDVILTTLSSETADALLAAGGKEALKKTLMEQLNKAVPETKVEEIYFTEFLVQR
jgi:flagellar FliL protein